MFYQIGLTFISFLVQKAVLSLKVIGTPPYFTASQREITSVTSDDDSPFRKDLLLKNLLLDEPNLSFDPIGLRKARLKLDGVLAVLSAIGLKRVYHD